MSNRKKLIWGIIGILGCLYFFKNPDAFASITTDSTRWFSDTLSKFVKIG